MLQFKRTARFVATLAVTGALALPSFAQGKMMDSKMAPKMSGGKMMGSKMSGGKMMSGKMMGHGMMSDKMVCQMCKMSASESKTYMSMSKAEKALFMKYMDKMDMEHGKMMSGHMSGKM